MSSAQTTLQEWARQGMPWAEAILVKAQHSSPLPPGARLFVNQKGEMHGAISLGCVESDIREHLLQVLKSGESRLLHYGAASEFSYEVGLSCGGEIEVLLRPQPRDEVWQALAARPPEQPAILLTCVTPPHAGSQRILLRGGAPAGSLGDAALDRDAAVAAEPLWSRGGHATLKLGETHVFAESLEPPPTLAIVGASPIAIALCRMAATTGFRVVIVDPRKVYAQAELFSDAARVIHEWPEEGLKAAGIGEDWYVAVLAHDPKLDLPALATALRHRCRYIGLLGSRITQEKRRSQLLEEGFTPAEIEKIHGPIGLPCGALDPAEIAVSILAELIGHRRRAPSPGLSGIRADGAATGR